MSSSHSDVCFATILTNDFDLQSLFKTLNFRASQKQNFVHIWQRNFPDLNLTRTSLCEKENGKKNWPVENYVYKSNTAQNVQYFTCSGMKTRF